jgi:two-component system response regulator AtoC
MEYGGMLTLNVSIIEASEASRETLTKLCVESGWKPRSFASIEEFAAAARGSDCQLLFLSAPDSWVSGGDEAELRTVRSWRETHRQTQLVLLTPQTCPAADRFALALGARYTLASPWRKEDVVHILVTVAQGVGKRTQSRALATRARRQEGFEEIIAVSDRMLDVLALARKVAAADTTSIMITGECGTGKGALASAMHLASPRREGPFIEVNCAAIPRTLLESEFFGYEAGAFTDAKEEKMGLFECANGGSIFLDEVGEIDYTLQAKLLKFLDSRVIRRVSGTRFLPVDVRVISATNADLKKAVADRRFREDLYYRLNVVEINVPPLRERRADIRAIAPAYAGRFAARLNKGDVALSEDALRALERYAWPGNVRELINVIERAVLLNATGVIGPNEFPFDETRQETIVPVKNEKDRIVIELPPEGISYEAFERALIIAALARGQGNITRAARSLKVGRGTLRYKMKKLGIEPADAKKNLQTGSLEPAPVTD